MSIYSQIIRIVAALFFLSGSFLFSGCAAAPLAGYAMSGAVTGGMIVASRADEEKLTKHMARNLGVDESRIVLTNVEKEAQMFGMAGNKYYFDLEVLPEAGGTYSQKQRCQVMWHAFSKSPALCSDLGTSAVSINSSGGISIGLNPASQDSSRRIAHRAHESGIFEAQKRLNSLGYDAGPEDGLMGPRTASALGMFQKDRNLRVTNLVDEKTLYALRDASSESP